MTDFINSQLGRDLLEIARSIFPIIIWKGIDRADMAAAGDGDLDILVTHENKENFEKIAISLGWWYASSRDQSVSESISHLFKYDLNTRKIIHIHLHSRIISKNGFIAPLSIGFEGLHIKHSYKIANNIYATIPELELIMLLIRTTLEVSHYRFFSRKRKIKNCNLKAHVLIDKINPKVMEDILKEPALDWLSSKIVLDILNQKSINTKTIDTIRIKIVWSIPRDISQKSNRLVLKSPAPMIAVVGPDGSGKTTIIKKVVSLLNSYIEIRVIYMGGSQNSTMLPRKIWRTFALPIYAILWRILKLFKAEIVNSKIKKWFYGIEQLFILEEKASRYKKAKSLSARGILVVFERFPIFPGYGDMEPTDVAAPVINFLKKRYQDFVLPDLLCFLDLPPQIASQRKKDESPEILGKKALAFSHYYNQNSKHISLIDSRLSIDDTSDKLVQLITKKISY